MITLSLKRDGQSHCIESDTGAATHITFLKTALAQDFRRVQNRIDKVDKSVRLLTSSLIAKGWLNAYLDAREDPVLSDPRHYLEKLNEALCLVTQLEMVWTIAVNLPEQKLSVYVQHLRINLGESDPVTEQHEYELSWKEKT